MSEFMQFCGIMATLAIIFLVVALSVAAYHWGRFEGELIGRSAERCRDAETNEAQP